MSFGFHFISGEIVLGLDREIAFLNWMGYVWSSAFVLFGDLTGFRGMKF